MTSDYKALGDIAEFFNSRRIPITSSDRKSGPFPYYGAAGVQDWVEGYIFDGLYVLVGEDGTVRTSSGNPVVQLVDGKFWVNNHAHIIRCSSDEDTRFLSYSLALADIVPFITGAVQPKVNMRNLKSVMVAWPEKGVRHSISEIGKEIDRCVAVLLEANLTLESMAQAIYKSWFVDFDPVKSKSEGLQAERMDKATFELFPERLETHGDVVFPAGWGLRPLYDLATYVNGASYKAFSPNHEGLGLPIIKIAELKAGVTAQTAYSNLDMPEKYRIKTGDILFSWSGNPDTSIDTFVWPYGDAWLNQHIFRVIPCGEVVRSFLLQTLREALIYSAEPDRSVAALRLR